MAVIPQDEGSISGVIGVNPRTPPQISPRFANAMIGSAARKARASMVIVGWPRPEETKLLAEQKTHLAYNRRSLPVSPLFFNSYTMQPQRTVRVTTLTQQGAESDVQQRTPAERLAMVWPLTLQAWIFTGKPLAQSRLPRHTVRILRRKR